MSDSNSSAHHLSLLLYSSSRLLIQQFQIRLNELNLTYPQYLVMSVLWEEDGLLVNKIGQKLHLDSGTLTPLLKKLESMNFVKRNRSESDERTVAIQLTYPGKSLQVKVLELLKPLEENFSEIENPELSTLNHSIKSLLERIESSKNRN
ncbi:MAG: MarR family transcriptional regulator [Algoriphagus sp.]|nr:MarR family transcriptional regulator [Algoriphagus sp.]